MSTYRDDDRAQAEVAEARATKSVVREKKVYDLTSMTPMERS